MVGQNVATSTIGTIDVQVRELKSAFCKLSYILMLIWITSSESISS